MPDTNSNVLPNGVKVRGGAYLVAEVLTQNNGEVSYHAYDIAARGPVILHEFFPTGARRENLQVVGPSAWTTQGFDMAKAKWLQNHIGALAIFEENGTAYLVTPLQSPSPQTEPAKYQTQSLSQTQGEPGAVIQPPIPNLPLTIPQSPLPQTPIALAPLPQTLNVPSSASPRQQFSVADLWPDALRGGLQGGLLCGVAGVLLGALAAIFGGGNLLLGALLGTWAFPVGAVGGAILGALRALPSNAPALASASALTPQQQIENTLTGAGKGALLGLPLGMILIFVAMAGGNSIPVSAILRALILFALAGAIGGAVVGFIRINPRDRSRRS